MDNRFLTVVLAFVAASMDIAYMQCTELCIPPIPTGDQAFCINAETYFSCLETKILNNPDCDRTVKDNAKTMIDGAKRVMAEIGCVTDCQPSCEMPETVDKQHCSKMVAFYSCIQTQIMDNSKCSDAVKTAMTSFMENKDQMLKESNCEVTDDKTTVTNGGENKTDAGNTGAETVTSKITMTIVIALSIYIMINKLD